MGRYNPTVYTRENGRLWSLYRARTKTQLSDLSTSNFVDKCPQREPFDAMKDLDYNSPKEATRQPTITTFGANAMSITITPAQLAAGMSAHTGASAVSFVAMTPVSKISAKSPYKGAMKRAKISAIVGADYEAKVNRTQVAEGKEGTFEAGARQWGHNVGDAPMVEHNGKFYLSVVNGKELETEYFHADGRTMSAAEVSDMFASHMIPSYYAAKEQVAAHQGVETENAVKFQNYSVSNIRELNYKGQNYLLAGF